MTTDETVPGLLFSRDVEWEGNDGTRLRRGVQSGAFVRIRRGVYTDSSAWSSADGRAQHLARMHAVAETRCVEFCFSHVSAAALWGVPIIGRWPEAVHARAMGQSNQRSRNGVVWHSGEFDAGDIESIGGYTVTSLSRTLIDLAKTTSFESAVASLDYGIRPIVVRADSMPTAGVSKESLLERLEREGPRRGSSRALAACAFSDARAGSPGESLSRVQIRRLGYPDPMLQSRIGRSDGGADYPDFEWEGHFGEFDGHAKYTREEYTGGRTIEEIVWAEKLREDRLRATGKRVVRWTWREASRPELLDQRLRSAGLERRRGARSAERARFGRD